ncbi:MAG: peroxiredoxin [Candidatus Thermoplasmatota archaeon]|nr:peroxiredoxin [Candidatus Thermoplasmatota archaeon]
MVELLKAGTSAPDFEALDHDGNKVKLSSFKGKPVVLYFYPKDDTPGCTAEACNFRDNTELFEKKGIKVIGVSTDTVSSHKKFYNKYGLTFTLVSDSDKKISESYGTLNGSTDKRVTYIIDRSGKIAYVYEKVSPKEQGTEILSKLQELKLA